MAPTLTPTHTPVVANGLVAEEDEEEATGWSGAHGGCFQQQQQGEEEEDLRLGLGEDYDFCSYDSSCYSPSSPSSPSSGYGY